MNRAEKPCIHPGEPQAGVSISKERFDALDAFLLTVDGMPCTKKEQFDASW